MEWPAVGGDLGNTRYSSLDQINTENIAKLGIAWSVKMNSADTISTPVVRDGYVFLTAGSMVYALDPESGQTRWKFQPAARPARGGVSVGGGRVYVGLANSNVIALDEKSGSLLWTSMVGDATWNGVTLGVPPDSKVERPPPEFDPAMGQYVPAAPAYANGVVIAGLANGDFGLRGRIVGLNAIDGSLAWIFYTIPGPGERGHDSWPQDSEVWKTGGGGVWMTPAIDTKLNMVYLGVGNPVPQWAGENRVGDNLFTDSVVALDIQTGHLNWYFQLVHHDVWDQDVGTPLVLFNWAENGNEHPGLAAMRTDGYLFQLDRRTGKPLKPIVERRVPNDNRTMSSTQPFPIYADSIGPRCVEKGTAAVGFLRKCYFDEVGTEPNLLFPFSTTRAAPMSFSPKTGLFYVAAGIEPTWVQRAADPYYMGLPKTAGITQYGLIVALNSRTGRIAWQHRVTHKASAGSGVMSTAGGLVFHGQLNGQLLAFDARKGILLWTFQTGSAVLSPPSSYEVNGRQYILVPAGELLAFSLGGNTSPRAAPPAPETESKLTGPVVRTDKVEIGATVFDVGTTGQHAIFDEYSMKPARARVVAGSPLRWVNTGHRSHTIQASDGSWTTGPIRPGESKTLVMAKRGTYIVRCKEHPWSIAELVVDDEAAVNQQVGRGEALYQSACARCHRADLSGREPAPALSGPLFDGKWRSRSLGEFYEFLRKAMPPGGDRRLNEQQYLDMAVFVLRSNEMLPETTELTPDVSKLNAVEIIH
jgi:PQQ-dependent dehydrogenase (methanol/ethanol family)